MVCPNCKLADLTITNENYFCPSCKIFIGKVSDFKDETAQSFRSGILITDKPIHDKSSTGRNWLFIIFAPIILLVVAFFSLRDLVYADFYNSCYIFIAPSVTLEFSNSGVKRAIEITKAISPENYKNICERVSVISTDPSCGGFEGGCFEPTSPRTIYVSAPSRNITWVAEVLAHEACHARQMHEDRDFDEKECHEIGLKVMQEATVY